MRSEQAQKVKNLLSRKSETADELAQILSKLYKYQFMLVSGKAGTGKSYLLQKLRLALSSSNLRVVVAAPTGVAAVNISGTTLHSWLGMGLASNSIEELKTKLTRKARKSLTQTDVLLIDEISMVDPEFFENISHLAQFANKIYSPFARIKVIMFGDFLQLPPVTKDESIRFVFQTQLWKRMHIHRIRLTHIHRQNDPDFLQILNEVRTGVLSQTTHQTLLARCMIPPPPYTRLCTFRNQVNAYNKQKLLKIETPSTTYKAYYEYKQQHPNCEMSQSDLKSAATVRATAERYFPVREKLVLKVTAQVMMRCNAYIDLNICNGSIGNVIQLGDKDIIVNFSGVHVRVTRHQFIFQVGQTVNLIYYQFPLCLSWAITTHKAQGLTIDRILVDTNCFETGQMYTAFSRVRNLADLFLTSFDKNGLKVDQKALIFETYE